MSRQARLRSLEERLEAQGYSKHDVVYRTTLATLVRCKVKVRVIPRITSGLIDRDKMQENQRPTPHGTRMDPDDPPPPPYGCDPECETCFTQTFPARIRVTNDVAQTRVASLTTEITKDLEALRIAVRDHADYIVTKWRKSKAKRSSVLSAVYTRAHSQGFFKDRVDSTGLYDKKWAAVHLIDHRSHGSKDKMYAREMFKGTEHENDLRMQLLAPLMLSAIQDLALDDQKTRYETTWLLPYLDVESLVDEPLLFLSLLHARIAHSPEDWMMFDNFQLKLAEHWEIVVAEFNPHFVRMTGADYGMKFIDWNKDDCHHWRIVGYNKAICILTAQRHMMRLLREIVGHLLGERTSDQRREHHPKWEQLQSNSFFSFGTSSSFRIRASANQAFSAPPTFDPVQTHGLIASMYQACADELDLAQTSPAFVQCLIRVFRISLYSKTWGKGGLWDTVVDEIMCTIYRRFIWWRQMHKESEIMLENYN